MTIPPDTMMKGIFAKITRTSDEVFASKAEISLRLHSALADKLQQREVSCNTRYYHEDKQVWYVCVQ